MKYAGIEIEPIDLTKDPEYRKMVAVGQAIARFQYEIDQEKKEAELAKPKM